MPENDESGHASPVIAAVEEGELQSSHGSPGSSSVSSRSPGAVFPAGAQIGAESSASPTSSESSSLKGTPTKATSKSANNKNSSRLNVPRNIPLSRISSTSSSSVASSEVADEGSEDAAEDPRSLKAAYATLGELVFSRCSYNASSKNASNNQSHKDFKDRADELREKIKQRKSNKDRNSARSNKVASTTSTGDRNPESKLNDELIHDLDMSNSDGESQPRRERFKDPRLKKSKQRVKFVASENEKVSKKKMRKDSKLAKLDLLEEYAQMLRDAIKEEVESDENSDKEHSASRKRKSSKQVAYEVCAKQADDITEVIKIEPLSSDEMDVADSPSPIREAPHPDSPLEKKETLLPKVKEEEIVYIKTEPSDDYNNFTCANANDSCNPTIPVSSSNNISNNVVPSSSFAPNFSTNAVSSTLPQSTPSHLTPPTLPLVPLPLPPVPFSARPRLSFCPHPTFDSAMNSAQPRPPPPPPPPIPFPTMETLSSNLICNSFNMRSAPSNETYNPTVSAPTRLATKFNNLSLPPPFSQTITSIGNTNPLPVLSQISNSLVPPFPPTVNQNGSVPAPTFPTTLPHPGPPPLSLPNINSLPNIPLPPLPLSNPIAAAPPLQVNLKPVAQVNSTIVLDPNNPSAPLTFNTKLTSYIPESSVQVTPTFSNANFSSTHSTCQSTINSSLSSSDSKFPSTITNMKSENTVRAKPVDVASSSLNRVTSMLDQSVNRLCKKRPRSPSPVKVSIDFSRNISFESFLGTGLALNHRPSTSGSQVSKANWMYDNVNQFDFVAFKSEVNQHSWMPVKATSKLKRIEPRPSPLIVSTPALGYYLPSECGLSLLNGGTTDRMKELHKAFQVFMQSLSRDQLCQISAEQARELNSVMNSLSNIVLRLGSDSSVSDRKNSGNNKKTAEAMLKQLRITVTGSNNGGSQNNEDEIWKSNLETLLSTENDKTKSASEELPGEVYHSKTARSKKKRLRNVKNGDSLKRSMKNKIDTYLEQSNIDDDLVHEKFKLEYVSLQKADECRLHQDIYPNESNYHCDKPACTCLGDNKTTGPHHNVFYNEPKYEQCDIETNNLSVLYHYYINMKPNHHFFLIEPSKIEYDGNTYLFNGFSIFSHECLDGIPAASYTKGQTRYTLELIREKPPTSFCVQDCDLLTDFIFDNLLEFLDFTLLDTKHADTGDDPGCRKFHFLPRFERQLPEAGIEVLSAHEVLRHIISSFAPLFDPAKTADTRFLDSTLENRVATSLKDHLVYYPGKKPLCVRVDNLNFKRGGEAPKITHTSLLPSSLSFLGDKKYLNLKKLHSKIRETMHFRNDPNDQEWLLELERMMNEHKKTKRATVLCELPGENCYFSGLKCDITHCAVFLPRIVFQLQRHLALQRFCHKFNYTIRNPLHFEVAFTHSTAPENVLDGTNKSHVRASRYRVGKNMNDVPINERSGDMKLKAAKHKRNLFTMIQTMRKLPMNDDQVVDYPTTENYERIEFLGDAVLELIVTTHLFFMLPEAKEGILSLFRIPLVANTHLSKVSKRVGLHRHLVISHDAYFNLPGPREKIHADILEAFLGAVFLDSGLDEADRLFALMFFPNAAERKLWTNLKPHEFQVEYPQGDRHLIEKCATLQKLTELENLLGLKFKHISLLGRALSSSSLAYNFLSRTNNERMEYLGDTVMKFLVTNFIYRHFPVYHENHLSTLRGSLVSRFVQEEVARELRLSDFTLEKLCVDLTQQQSSSLTTKRKADLFEAFLAAVFIDQGLETCQRIFKICIFPKIPKLLKFQRWLTPHLMLHCCFLAIRSVADFEKSLVLIPSYRVLSPPGLNEANTTIFDKSKDYTDSQAGSETHTNTRNKNNSSVSLKRVGVFVGGKMFGVGTGKSLNQAAIQACREALAFFQSKHPNTLATMLNSRVDSIVNNVEQSGICDYSNNGSSDSNIPSCSQKSVNSRQTSANQSSNQSEGPSSGSVPKISGSTSQRGKSFNSSINEKNGEISKVGFGGDNLYRDRSVNDKESSGVNSTGNPSYSSQYANTNENVSTKSSSGAAIDSQSAEFSSNKRNFYQIFSAY